MRPFFTGKYDMEENKPDPATYELKLRILGNEVFAVPLSTSNSSNRWTILSVCTILATLLLLVTYGTELAESYRTLSEKINLVK